MTLSERIEEIIRSHYNDIIVDKSILAPKSLTVAILKAVEEEIDKLKITCEAHHPTSNWSCICGKIEKNEIEWNQALKELRQRLGI